jgi:hypothetical protein
MVFGQLPILIDNKVEKMVDGEGRNSEAQPVRGRLVVVQETAAEVGFQDHFRQKIDQVMEAPLTFLKVFGSFENLLFEKLPIDEQR